VTGEIVYLDGTLLPRSQARVSVFDQGFLYGYALFETMRAYKGTIFLLERHLARLRSSAESIGLGSSLTGVSQQSPGCPGTAYCLPWRGRCFPRVRCSRYPYGAGYGETLYRAPGGSL